MTAPIYEVAATSRDEQALDALRARVLAIDGLWQLFLHNRATSAELPDATVGYIAETPLGGPTVQDEIGQGSDTTPVVREFTRSWQLLVHAPAGTGLAHVAQTNAIESALRARPITCADDEASGPIVVSILSVDIGSPRPPRGSLAHVTVPVIVLYRFLASS